MCKESSIFNKSYWKSAADELKDVKIIAFAALILALNIVMQGFFVPVGESLRVYFTFIIKGIMGFAIGKIVYGHVDIKHFIIGGIVALVIVTGGYFVAEIPLMGYETALVSLISSPIQWCMSMVASAIIVPILIKNRKRIGF